jgi:hypothetical protein
MHTGGGVYHQWQLDASSDEPCCWADAIAQRLNHGMKISVRVFIRTKTISSSLNLFRFTKIYCIQDVAKQFMAAKLLVFAPGLQILPSVETLLGRNKILCQFS